MQQKAIPRLFMVQRLYRRVLKLHRNLPSEFRKLGDEYAKDEFRRHRDANQLQAHEFMAEWKNYADMIEQQSKIQKPEIGKNLSSSEIDSLSQEQVGQLYQLQHEALNPSKTEE